MGAGLLLRDGCVLSLDKRVGNLERADVLIEDGVVSDIGTGLRAGRDVEVVDASDRIVMPGLVDAHRHLWRSLLRGSAVPPAALLPHHRPDDVYAATLLGLLSAVEAGTTTVVDIADVCADDSFAEAAHQAHLDAGIRTVLAPCVPESARDAVDVADVLRGALARTSDGPALTTMAAASDADLADPDRVAASWQVARALGLRIHAHACGPADRGAVARLAERGLLGDDVTLADGANLSDADLDAIASSGCHVALTPSCGMASGTGIPPVQQLIDRDIRPGLGVEDDVLTPGTIFTQMRAAQSLQHATTFDRKLAGKAGLPPLLSTREVIRYATVDGARAAGVGDRVGTLAPGNHADLITLRTDLANIAPVNDPIGAVVWGMDPANLDLVVVAGRVLVRGGHLEGDVEHVRSLAATARAHLVEAGAGLASAEGGRA